MSRWPEKTERDVLEELHRKTEALLNANPEMLRDGGYFRIETKTKPEKGNCQFIHFGAVPDNAAMCYGTACERVD